MTNPYRVGDTVYWSKTRYDELGRAVETYAPATLADVLANNNLQSLGVTSFGISTVSGYVGTVVTTTDASNRKGRSITNALGQLIRVDEPTSISTNADTDLGTLAAPTQATYYKYNAQGKMVEVTQGVQKRWFKYDSLGRLIRVRQPEQERNSSLDLADSYNTDGYWTAAFAYDVLGNVVRATDAKGVNIINDYDKANRVINRCYSKPNVNTTATACIGLASGDISTDTPYVNFFYDGKGLTTPQSPNYAKGKLTKVTSSVSETQNTLFDNFGRITESKQITDGNTYISRYTYNLSGALVEEEYPSGRKVKNEFESDGDLSRVTSAKNAASVFAPYVSNFSYTASGGISQMRLGNGRWETAQFNNRMQVTELGLGYSSANSGLWKVNYDYGELDAGGNVDTAKNTGNIAKQTLSFNGLTNPLSQAYKYDSLYRLTEAKETPSGSSTPSWIQNWTYDRYGNRATFTQNIAGNTTVTNPTVDQNTNRFVISGTNFQYDPNGNLTRDAEGRQFTFNGDNKQTQVKDSNNAVIGTYLYDGEGKRVKKKVYDPNNPSVVTEETVFVYSSGKLVAEYSTQLSQNPTTSYTTTDHLGSPRVITDQLGQVKSRRDFLPFGEELTINVGARSTNLQYGSFDNIRQKFTGYQKDTETNLDFAEARMYENRHGRFTAIDPLLASGKSENPQTFNRYSYVLNGPIVFRDVDGRIPVYFSHLPDGKIHWTTDQSYAGKEGYSRYEGKDQKIRGDDGKSYLVRRDGIFATKKAGNDQLVPRSTAGKPVRANNAMPINDALLKDLGDKAPGMQKMILVLALSSVAGGAGAAGTVAAPTFYLVIGAETFTAVQGLNQLSEADRQRAVMMMGSTQLQASGTIDPSKVMFSQDSISPNFKDPQFGSVDDLAEGLRNKTIDPNSIDPIRVFEKDGKIISLDNRRLEAFRQAGIPIRYRLATGEEIGLRRITTRNGGTSIRIRGR